MLGLEVRFDLGRYHATPWGSNVNDAAVEWPPSPWRILRGLYAVGHTHAQLASRREDLDRAVSVLASAPPPVYELPATLAAHTRHYMPVPEGRKERSAKILDGFLALDRDAPVVAWWDASLDGGARGALDTAARCLGYLGRSEAVCSARLVADGEPKELAAAPVEADIEIDPVKEMVELLCVDSSEPLLALATGVSELRAERRRVPSGTRRVTYRLADREVRPASDEIRLDRPKLALLRVTGRDQPSLTEAVRMGQLLRSALQSRYGKLKDGAASTTFSGRAGDLPRHDQHQHAHYLSLPGQDGRRIDRLLVWAPEGLGQDEVSALAAVRTVWDPTIEGARYPVALGALGHENDLALPHLLGPAKEWRSLTPFALVRHPKTKRGEIIDGARDQILRELAFRGLPEPEEVEELRRGRWHRFRSSRLGETRVERRPLAGVRIRFPQEVRGPIAIGGLSHYGLGLMVSSDST